MMQFFDTISGLIDKITQFFQVILDKLLDAWESVQVISSFFPPALAGVIITVITIAIVFRVLGR